MKSEDDTIICSSNRFDVVFVIAMYVLIALFTILLFCNPHGGQLDVFFGRTENFFADYFNVAKMAVGGNPYWYGLVDPAPQEHGYPPLAYLLFVPLSRFADYENLSAFDAGYTTSGMLSAVLFTVICSFIFFLLLQKAYGKRGILNIFLPSALMFSSIFLFSFERANTIILTVSLLIFFVLNYKSEHRIIKELALLALAAATGLKGYPALMGMLLLFEKDYWAALRAAVYGVALVFLPFLCFAGGFGNISLWVANIKQNSIVYGANLPQFGLSGFLHIFGIAGDSSIRDTLDAVTKTLCIFAILLSLFQKTKWKQVMLLLLSIVCLQTNNAEYLGLYLFLGIVFFFNQKSHVPLDWLYLVCFVLILNPVQLSPFDYSLTQQFMNLGATAMFIALILESTKSAVQFFKQRKSGVLNGN